MESFHLLWFGSEVNAALTVLLSMLTKRKRDRSKRHPIPHFTPYSQHPLPQSEQPGGECRSLCRSATSSSSHSAQHFPRMPSTAATNRCDSRFKRAFEFL